MKRLEPKILQIYLKDLFGYFQEYKSLCLFIFAFVLVSDVRQYPVLFDLLIKPSEFNETFESLMDISYYPGKSIVNISRSLIRFFLYPINLWLFGMDFTKARVPEIYIFLVPLVLLYSIGFLIIIMTED